MNITRLAIILAAFASLAITAGCGSNESSRMTTNTESTGTTSGGGTTHTQVGETRVQNADGSQTVRRTETTLSTTAPDAGAAHHK